MDTMEAVFASWMLTTVTEQPHHRLHIWNPSVTVCRVINRVPVIHYASCQWPKREIPTNINGLQLASADHMHLQPLRQIPPLFSCNIATLFFYSLVWIVCCLKGTNFAQFNSENMLELCWKDQKSREQFSLVRLACTAFTKHLILWQYYVVSRAFGLLATDQMPFQQCSL